MNLEWQLIGNDDDPSWHLSRVLYAYVDLTGDEILYIGKADGSTVRQRWTRQAKKDFWNDLEVERGIDHHDVIVGVPILAPGRRLTRELIADVESLLISHIKPWGNIASTKSRIRRPGLRVLCTGDWIGRANVFEDG